MQNPVLDRVDNVKWHNKLHSTRLETSPFAVEYPLVLPLLSKQCQP